MSIRVNGKAIAGSSVSGLKKYQPYNIYRKDDVVFQVSSTQLVYFVSLVDNNAGNPVTNSLYWKRIELEGQTPSNGFNLFDIVEKDHILTYEESLGFTRLGEYAYKNSTLGVIYGYPDFYEKCLKQYKECTEIEVLQNNFTTTGTPKYENGIMSEFSTSVYATMNKSFNSSIGKSSWEIVCKFKLSQVNKAHAIIGGQSGTYLLDIKVKETNKFAINLSSNGTSYDITGGTEDTAEGNYVIPGDVWHWVKLEFTGSYYQLSYSLDNETWMPDIKIISSTPLEATTDILTIGFRAGLALSGEIDLKQSYIKIDNNLWWEGCNYLSKHDNGHAFYNIKDKAIIDNIYSQTGMAWYYGIDEENERICIPRNDYFFQPTSDEQVSKVVKAGLPNITGTYSASELTEKAKSVYATGAFYDAGNHPSCNYNASGDNNGAPGLIGFNASRSNSIYGGSSTVQPNAVKLAYYMVTGNIQNDLGYIDVVRQSIEGIEDIQQTKEQCTIELQQEKDLHIIEMNSYKDGLVQQIIEESGNESEKAKYWAEVAALSSSNAMFDIKLVDHILLGAEAAGWELQGTYVYKEAVLNEHYGYPDFYNKVIEEYSECTQTETVNDVTIKVHTNGHKFYDITDKEAIDSSFNSIGMAWYYGVDIENERILLPRNNWFEQATTLESEVGQSVEAGLPNITGTFYNSNWKQMHSNSSPYASSSGAFTNTNQGGTGGSNWGANGGVFTLNAANSSAVYGKSSTVQPNAVKRLLYICVGNTKADTSWITLTEQVNEGIKEIQDTKVDSLEEILDNAETSMNSINENRQNTLNQINVLTTNSNNELTSLTEQCVDQITELTNNGISSINNASTSITQSQITNCILSIPESTKITLKERTYDISVPGDLKVNNNGLSGFTTSTVSINKIPESVESFEIVFKFTTSDDVTTPQVIYGQLDVNMTTPQLACITEKGTVWCGLSSTGESWNGDLQSEVTLEPNKTYIHKLTWDGIKAKSYISDNEYITEDNLISEIEIPAINWVEKLRIGSDQTALNTPFLGTIHINECYINLNGNRWWTGQSSSLTLHKGSRIIIPYSYKETTEYKIGDTFKNSNFKIIDTSFFKNCFYFICETQNDIIQACSLATDTQERYIGVSPVRNNLFIIATGVSSTDAYISEYNYMLYNSASNSVIYHAQGTGVIDEYGAFPVGIVKADGVTVCGSIKQLFDRHGYIGNTKWLDKGVKLLCSNGHNNDGTYKNIEYTTNEVSTYTGGTSLTEYCSFYDYNTKTVSKVSQNHNTHTVEQLSELDHLKSAYVVAYVKPQNKFYYHESNGEWIPFIGCEVGRHTNKDTTGLLSQFTPNKTFRAVNSNELNNYCIKPASTVSTASKDRPAVVVENYRSGTSWYRKWSDGWIEQGGKISISSAGQVVNLLVPMSDTNYHCNSTGGTSKFGNTVMYSLTTTSFQAWTSDDDSFNAGILFWEVKGY